VGGRPGSEESLAGLLPPRHGLIIVHVGTPHASTGMPVSNLRTTHARCRFVFFSQGRRVASRNRFRLAADLVEVVAPRYRAVATSRLSDLPNRRHQIVHPAPAKSLFRKSMPNPLRTRICFPTSRCSRNARSLLSLHQLSNECR
jgi:hypothetical protein